MVRYRSLIIIALLLIGLPCFPYCPSPLYAQNSPQISVEISPKSGTLDDNYLLLVEVTNFPRQINPILSGAEDFEIVSIGPESSVQIVQGQVRTRAAFRYKLIPTRDGLLKTPDIEVPLGNRTLKADALTVRVDKPIIPKNFDSSLEVFFRQKNNKSEAYLGQQVVNELEFFTRIAARDIEFIDAGLTDAWVQKIGKIQKSVQLLDGFRYRVLKSKRAFFPLKSGEIVIPSHQAKLLVAGPRNRRNKSLLDLFDDPFFNSPFDSNWRPQTVRSNTLSLMVKDLPPKPQDFPDWGLSNVLVGKTRINLNYSEDEIKYGQSKTLDISITSQANLSPINKINTAWDPAIKVYQESPELIQNENLGKLVSNLKVSLSVVPTNSGQIRLAPLALGYFDPESETYRIAKTAEVTFNVLGGPPAVDKTTPQTSGPSAGRQHASQDPQHSVIEPYKEDSFLKKLSSQISLSLSLLIVFSGLFICLILAVLLKRIRANKPIKKLLSNLEQATELKQIDQAFRQILSLKYRRECMSLGSDQIKNFLRSKIDDNDTLYLAQAVLDEMDTYRYGGKLAESKDLDRIRGKIAGFCRVMG